MKPLPYLKRMLAAGIIALALALSVIFPAYAATRGSAQQSDQFLPRGKFTIKSVLSIDLTRDFATMPLHKGNFHGTPVWYVITDASDAGVANTLGLNFAPLLANTSNGCPFCVQQVTSTSTLLGRGMVDFKGIPDFSPTRLLMPGPHGFPPLAAQPGGMGRLHYSPFVRIKGTSVVYDAPIVAVGNGPFDVIHHKNTHDRVLTIDTQKMTVGLLFVRGFSNGKPILYLSFETSDALTATIERSTFVPALSLSPFPNGDSRDGQARAEIFTFTNGATGPQSPPAQGLMHVIINGLNAQEANLQNTALLEALRIGGDAHNVFSFFPTLRDPNLAQDYSPLWDLNIGVWSKFAVAHGLNTAKTDANEILELAAKGLVTSPGGSPLASSGSIINCPALAFTDTPPTTP